MRAIPPLLSLLLVACQGPAGEQVPTEPLAGEEQALADAEAMIEESSARLEAEDRKATAEGAEPRPNHSSAGTDQ